MNSPLSTANGTALQVIWLSTTSWKCWLKIETWRYRSIAIGTVHYKIAPSQQRTSMQCCGCPLADAECRRVLPFLFGTQVNAAGHKWKSRLGCDPKRIMRGSADISTSSCADGRQTQYTWLGKSLGQVPVFKVFFRLSNIKPSLRLFRHVFKHCSIRLDKVHANPMIDTHPHIRYTGRRLV